MKDMHEDLYWLATNVSEWDGGVGSFNRIMRYRGQADYCQYLGCDEDGTFKGVQTFAKGEWLQARKDLGLDQPEVTDAEEEKWQRMEWSKQITDTDDEAQALEDMVNHPPHYQSDNGIECIDAIRAALGLDGFVAHCRGTAIKYCWRSGKKQAHAEDLRKAAWYLNEAADALEKQ